MKYIPLNILVTIDWPLYDTAFEQHAIAWLAEMIDAGIKHTGEDVERGFSVEQNTVDCQLIVRRKAL